jgi:fatty-acyl-CoA synthase
MPGAVDTVAGPGSPPPGFESLTPVRFLDRAADIYRERIAVVDGDRRWTYAEFRGRCLRLAGALRARGIAAGDRVAVLAPNTHVLLEAHYAVPYAGAVLVTLNTRLAAAELHDILQHSGAALLIVDPELIEAARQSTADLAGIEVLVVDDQEERWIAQAAEFRVEETDERSLLSLNYTSGTTGRPKGVMYHHRGAYLQALAMVVHFRLDVRSVYLWTLPMFHCNGWCFTWAVTAAGGTHVCLRRFDPDQAWRLVAAESVSVMCGAPTVLIGLAEAVGPDRTGTDDDRGGHRRITFAVGGAPPTPALLERCDRRGIDVVHLYGLTETFGPAAICEWKPEWDDLSADARARMLARQGVGNVVSTRLRVVDPAGHDVPDDGTSIGEVALRGNNVMLGYFRDPEATAAACPDGWFRTGDLGVMHPDHYLELRDRAKDVIISGGENISSIEVEAALATHPAVLEAAVVAAPDERWGERPVAWVTLRDDATTTVDELRAHVRTRLAGFKVPSRILFGPLPKTASGKVRKVALRESLRDGTS